MKRNAIRMFGLNALAALLTACGGAAEPDGAAEMPEEAVTEEMSGASALVGEWRLVEIDMGDGQDFTPSGDAVPTLNFTAEANPTGSRIFNGSGGCNRVMGGYDAGSTGRITFTSGPAMTMMACPDLVMRLEQVFVMGLEAARTYEVEGDRLSIDFGGGTLRMERVVG